MNPLLVIAALVALVGVATALGFAWQRAQGRISPTDGATVVRAQDLPGVASLGRGATLLQFSTEVCSPCKSTARILGQAAGERRDVTHVDLDLTHRPDLASKFRILQTPTTLILDRRGVVRARIGGAPRSAELHAELDRILAVA